MRLLPDYPAPAATTFSLLDFGKTTQPANGARPQRINRLGGRFQVEFTMPIMPSSLAQQWVADLIAAKSEGARINFPLNQTLELDFASPGAVVDGNDQTGTLLNITGLATPNRIYKGAFISVESGADRYLHVVTDEVIILSGTAATLNIMPPIRGDLLNGSPVRFADATLEGLIVDQQIQWEQQLASLTNISFAISEF